MFLFCDSMHVPPEADPVLLTDDIDNGRESFFRSSRAVRNRATKIDTRPRRHFEQGADETGDISGRDELGNFIWWSPPMQVPTLPKQFALFFRHSG